ncbi:Hypothetical predicted protein [Paramuricea clavata]|uniref:Uncharacterized protein n=1 Tax=Paramuricea clavata TaxID=317549 RepID=A0A6S7H3N7_PARCT|nr:Hypothetical predicted protein [Paramuricea clavata]
MTKVVFMGLLHAVEIWTWSHKLKSESSDRSHPSLLSFRGSWHGCVQFYLDLSSNFPTIPEPLGAVTRQGALLCGMKSSNKRSRVLRESSVANASVLTYFDKDAHTSVVNDASLRKVCKVPTLYNYRAQYGQVEREYIADALSSIQEIERASAKDGEIEVIRGCLANGEVERQNRLPFEGDRQQHTLRIRIGETINKYLKATTTGKSPAELSYGRNLGTKLWNTAIYTNKEEQVAANYVNKKRQSTDPCLTRDCGLGSAEEEEREQAISTL